jgi:hypothetical protein
MDDCEDFSFVDFDDVPEKEVEEDPRNNEIYFKTCKIEFDETTTVFYKVMRERKLNIFTQEDDIEPDKAFQYRYMWDVFTGEPLGIDPCGPLWFHPVELVHYFAEYCLQNLWHDQVDESGGIYEGYYGDLLGSGDDMYVKGRGHYTELYLFRLPIVDCYMPKDCNLSLITMGAKLTTADLQQIDDLVQKHYVKLYTKKYKKNPPSLIEMKKYYDNAISSRPPLDCLGYTKDDEYTMSEETLRNNRAQANILAVNNLKKLVGKGNAIH